MDIPAIVEALFGRKMTESAAREMANEIRARCKSTTQAEVKNAFRALAERTADQSNRGLPTAPEVAREIWAHRNAPKEVDQEPVEEALIAIGDEPCPSVRWSMLVHRGMPKALLEAVHASGIAICRWDKANPDFGWAVALMQDPEYMAAAKALADEYSACAAELKGRMRNRLRDAECRKFWQLFRGTVAKRQAEGWTPPAPATQGPIVQAMVRQLEAMLTP